MKLVSMKLSPAAQEKAVDACCAPPAPDAPRYPWGLTLNLDNEALDKLGIEKMPAAGAELLLVAKVSVTRTGSVDTAEGGKMRDLALQVTDMALEKSGRKSTAEALFGGKE